VFGVSSQLVLPKASAQQAATLTKWEYNCVDLDDDEATDAANKLGAQCWEMVGISRYPADVFTCFKRQNL
jgi:hypothetical protein